MFAATLRLCRLYIPSPLGELLALATDSGLCALEFQPPSGVTLHERLQRRLNQWFPPHEIVDGTTPILLRTRDWLSAYFDGVSAQADDVPLDLRGAPFELRVWAALVGIPPGATASYGAIATKLGASGASRAVEIGRAHV